MNYGVVHYYFTGNIRMILVISRHMNILLRLVTPRTFCHSLAILGRRCCALFGLFGTFSHRICCCLVPLDDASDIIFFWCVFISTRIFWSISTRIFWRLSTRICWCTSNRIVWSISDRIFWSISNRIFWSLSNRIFWTRSWFIRLKLNLTSTGRTSRLVGWTSTGRSTGERGVTG
jgi:hypothetical protein